jgi:hypothetical protein
VDGNSRRDQGKIHGIIMNKVSFCEFCTNGHVATDSQGLLSCQKIQARGLMCQQLSRSKAFMGDLIPWSGRASCCYGMSNLIFSSWTFTYYVDTHKVMTTCTYFSLQCLFKGFWNWYN